MCLRPWVRMLHSAEEDSLSSFDTNIAFLCQNIEINNKHIYMKQNWINIYIFMFYEIIMMNNWYCYKQLPMLFFFSGKRVP